jgi:sigma-B regulation protein RsbU (phosphoserine phosphatase)
VTGMTCFPPWGELGVVAGDVAGSGLAGAVVMGRMRSALHAYALEYPDPAGVLRKLDQKMQYFEGEVMATVSYAVLDPPPARHHAGSCARRSAALLHRRAGGTPGRADR